jgi:hypothetical protein
MKGKDRGFSENRLLRIIIGPKRVEETRQLIQLHIGDLHNLYSLSDIITQIKTRRMVWAGHVARMGKGEKCKGLWCESPEK